MCEIVISDKISACYERDDDGNWWYHQKNRRTKCALFECKSCGKLFPRIPSKQKGKGPNLCSGSCAVGKFNANWVGGITKTGEGYVKLQSPGHPFVDSGGYVFEHRLVMEKLIGRYLRQEEDVHHKGAKDDNRPEMLELWSGSHPRGHRVEEKVAWAEEILQLYAPEKLAPSP